MKSNLLNLHIFLIYNRGMENDIDILAYTLNLSPKQTERLFANPDKYDLSGLAVRGGVLYVPRKNRGIVGMVRRAVFGPSVDIIGR